MNTSPKDIDLAESFPHLARAPIVEAVIEVRARAKDPWEESVVLPQLKAKLPGYPSVTSQREFLQEVTFAPAQRPEAVARDLGWKGLRFQSADERHVAQFNREGFAFSRLHPYESWDQLYREAIRLWQIYVELFHPPETQRIGLRFINRIELSPREWFGDYIIVPHLPQDLGLSFIGFFHRDTLAVPGHPYAVNIIRTIQPEQNSGGVSVILDIDVFSLQIFALKQEALKQSLAEMRWIKNKIFFSSITQKALERFQ